MATQLTEYETMVKNLDELEKEYVGKLDKIFLDYIHILDSLSDVVETLNRDIINERNKYIMLRIKLKGAKDGQ